MSNRKILLDSYGNRKEVFHWSENAPDDFAIQTVEDCEPIVKAASIMADEAPGKDFRHAAYIPQAVMDEAFRDGWFHDKEAWKKWANDGANARFRTWKGRL
jgi:hypothetical protein